MRVKAIAIVRPPTPPKSLFVLRFAAWAAQAPELARSDAASALARAYLHSALPAPRRDEIATAMEALLDDPSINVRRALSDALSGAHDAPRALVVALANEETSVAGPLLLRSPLLSNAELADRILDGDAAAQCTIARRPGLGSLAVCALAERADPEPILTLLGNLDAVVPSQALRRIHARFGEVVSIREALLARPNLTAALKAEIALAGAESRDDERADGERGGRAARETRDASLVRFAAECDTAELPDFVRVLRARRALSLALLIRSVLSGESGLLITALAELADAPHAGVAALSRAGAGEGFAALGSRAGLPRHAVVVLLAALRANKLGRGERETGVGLRSDLIRATVAACEAKRDRALAPTIALLWRFAAEAARRDAPLGRRPCVL